MRAPCTFNLHVCKFPGTIHRVIVPLETHDRGDVPLLFTRLPCNLPRCEGRTINAVNRQDLYLKNNLTWFARENRGPFAVNRPDEIARPSPSVFPRTSLALLASPQISVFEENFDPSRPLFFIPVTPGRPSRSSNVRVTFG